MFVQGAPNCNGPIDDPREENLTQQTQLAKELETVVLSEEHPNLCIKIGTTLALLLRKQFIEFLQQHAEVFTWSYDDMSGISPEVISHKLSISPAY